MGAKDTWKAVASQRMGEPVLFGVWIGRKGAAARQMRSSAFGQIAGAVGGAVGELVADAIDGIAQGRKQAGPQAPTPQPILIPIKDFAYLAVSRTRLGLFHFDRESWRAKHAVKEPIFIYQRVRGMALQLQEKGFPWGKLTLWIPGYLPTPIISPRSFWNDLTAMSQELSRY